MRVKNPPFVRLIRYLYVYSWHFRIARMHFGFRIETPWFAVSVGHDSAPCRVCGTRALYQWDPKNPGAAICPDCCHHPDHEWERDQGAYCCVECGEADYEMERDYYED